MTTARFSASRVNVAVAKRPADTSPNRSASGRHPLAAYLREGSRYCAQRPNLSFRNINESLTP